MKPRYVWLDAKGLGRHVYALFRYDMRLRKGVQKATINLFADSRYHLKVNGEFVNYGPARFYPEHPEYDTYDISRFLRTGANVIAVKVVSHGMETFQSLRNRGGFIAWGEVVDGEGRRHDLATPGGWKCRKATGYDRTAPKFSFTSSPFDSYDAGKGVRDWDKPGIALRGWKPAVVLDNQDSWGRLTRRSIPHLTQDELVPHTLLGVYPLRGDRDIYSFRIPGEDSSPSQIRKRKTLFAYTYIYSPRAQKVKAGLFWGEYFLNNGRRLAQEPTDPARPNHQDAVLNLKKGWNYFFAHYWLSHGHWDFHISLPKEAGLRLSAEKKRGSPHVFMSAGPFRDDEEGQVQRLGMYLPSPEALPELSAGWVARPRNSSAGNPAWEMVWREFGEPHMHTPSRVRELEVHDPHGTALVFDMGHEVLGRVCVEFEAPKGTVVDAGYAEDMLGERPWLLKRSEIWAAERHISSGGPQRLETFKPRGFRYLQVNVTGNTKPARIRKVGVVQQVYTYTKIGSFECSDPMLNDIWELGWRTLRMCSEDAYTDCPWRERGCYGGDMLAEFGVTMATTGDVRLAKRCLALFVQSQDPVTLDMRSMVPAPRGEGVHGLQDYPVENLLNILWIVDWTGDLAFARKMYAPFRRLMEARLANRRPDGLFDGHQIFIDWIRIEKRKGYNAAMHALYAQGFAALARLAELLGKKGDAKRYREVAASVVKTVRRFFWDSARGAYRDGLDQKLKPLREYHSASSAWPSLYGMTSSAQEKQLVEHFAARLPNVGVALKGDETSPYGGFYILGALYRHGHVEVAERFMRDGWGKMIEAGADTAWEHFTDESSQCHAWSGAPTYYLLTGTLGVPLGFPEPLDPKRITIAPQAESLTWARGRVPHPLGTIEVDWRIEGDRLMVDYTAPKGVKCTVVPRGRLAKKELWVNGKKV